MNKNYHQPIALPEVDWITVSDWILSARIDFVGVVTIEGSAAIILVLAITRLLRLVGAKLLGLVGL